MAVLLPSSFAFGAPLPRSVHQLALHIGANLLRALLFSSNLVASVPFLPLFFTSSSSLMDNVFVSRVGEFSSAVRVQHYQEVRRFRCGGVVQ